MSGPLVISSSGLNPSNSRPGVFPNLCWRNPPADVIAAVTATAESELKQAGIEVMILPIHLPSSEVPSLAVGELSMWSFQRAWYYWIAEGPGLPVEIAEKLHEKHGQVVRVDGHCGCPSPREWFHGFGVGLYHVDTQEGLNALAEAIRSVWDGK